MSAYNSFAVVGAGVIGLPIVEALLARGASVLILARPSSSSRTIPSGAKLVSIDYTDSNAVAAVLREHKIQVVLSTVSGAPGLAAQPALAKGAKEAGVQLFAPSEYGMPSAGHTQGFLGIKSEFGDYLKSIGLPSARFYVGFFTDQIPWAAGLDETGNFYIIGKGNTPITLTSIADIAGFTAHVLTTLPPAQLADASFRIQGERTTLREVAARYGPDTEIVHADAFPSEVSDHALKTILHKAVEAGYASTGWDVLSGKEVVEDAGSSNGLWEGHQWQGLKEVLGI